MSDAAHEVDVVPRPRSVQVALRGDGMIVDTGTLRIADARRLTRGCTDGTELFFTAVTARVIHSNPAIICATKNKLTSQVANVHTGCRNVTQRNATHGMYAFIVNTLSLVNVYDLPCAWHRSNQTHLLKYTLTLILV